MENKVSKKHKRSIKNTKYNNKQEIEEIKNDNNLDIVLEQYKDFFNDIDPKYLIFNDINPKDLIHNGTQKISISIQQDNIKPIINNGTLHIHQKEHPTNDSQEEDPESKSSKSNSITSKQSNESKSKPHTKSIP